ncbi:MAG: exonuclease SbcCD subunit D, partial [Pirellulales bacterium]
LFLAEQFERLAAERIDVYWLLAPADPHGNWPARWPFPANVHPLDANAPDEQTYASGSGARARLVGWHPKRRGKKWPAETTRENDDQLPSVGIVYDPDGLRADRPHPFDYLALGGRHAVHHVPGSKQTAHYCGSPQGRTPFETGPHGCTLVEIASDRHVQLKLLTTDRARWIDQGIEIDGTADTDQFVLMLDERIGQLVAENPDRDLLISWSITGSGRLIRKLEETSLATDLLADLRSRHGEGRPMAWSVALSVERPVDLPADWQSEQTILGDFLRLVEGHRVDTQRPLDIERFLPGSFRSGGSSHGPTIDWRLEDPSRRQRILSCVERLGIELLGRPQTVDFVAREETP